MLRHLSAAAQRRQDSRKAVRIGQDSASPARPLVWPLRGAATVKQSERGPRMAATESKAASVVVPLPASMRVADDNYAGVVSMLGPDWRLGVTSKGDAYALHRRVPTDEGPRWVPAGGRSPTTLQRIVAKYGDKVEGLADLCAGLPDDPARAVLGFAAASQARRDAFDGRDITRDGYARVVARQGSLRLVVGPDGAEYVLQWIAKRHIGSPDVVWSSLGRFVCLADLWVYFRDKVGMIFGPGSAGVVRGDGLRDHWLSFVEGLPERAGLGVWPAVPAVPGASGPPSQT